MSEIEQWYKQDVDEDNIFGAGMCFCGKPGYHIDCQRKMLDIKGRFEKSDKNLLEKYAVNGKYGVLKGHLGEFNIVCEKLANHLRQKLDFDESKVIENEHWWFIPHGWIGVLGFIVEKTSDDIYVVGSRRNPDFEAYAYWHGIEGYSTGNGELYPRCM